MAKGSTRVVYVALAGNVAIAAAKFGAYFLSRSSGMFTEAIHSLVDSVDQVLLLVGQTRARKPPDAAHPLGHGMEAYFWSFVVAIMVLMLGGGVSVYEGLQRLREPTPIASPLVSFGVLGVAAIFDGLSLAVGIREYQRVVRAVHGPPVGLWRFIQLSKDPSLYASLLEDSFALVGVAIAALGVLGTSVFHIAAADGAASVAIGVLLAIMAIVLANETRSLIAGEAVAPPVMAEIREVLEADERIAKVADVATLHLGPRAILVALTLEFTPEMTLPDLKHTIDDLTAAMKKADERITYVYLRPAE